MSEQVEILHHLPGRVRIKVACLKDRPAACAAVENLTLPFPGVRDVKAHPVTGSIVVHYDKADPQFVEQLQQALKDLQGFLAFVDLGMEEAANAGEPAKPDGAPVPSEELVLQKLESVIDKSDQRIRQASKGAFNLPSVLPLILAGGLAFFNGKEYPVLLAGLLTMSFQSYVTQHQPEWNRSMRQPA